ncbi:putative glycoside hydrolase [Massilia sp. TN1-12]|uniref:putative glycoside hydrolase n=1 Tax=Massilia paldalensis TaxID=3377675 RepID=UPI00385079A9
MMNIRHPSLALACLFLAGSAAAAPALPLYVGKPVAGARVLYGDFDVQNTLDGARGRMDNDPKLPHAVVEAARTDKDAQGDALRLTWKDAWFSTVRIESAPLDLRPYLARGTVSFDLKVNEMSKGGLAFRIDCGVECQRRVPYVLPARADQGKGWKHLSYAMSCFAHDGDDFSAVRKPFALDGTGAGDAEIANIRFDAAGTPNAACADYRTVSVTPEPLNESWSLDWWMPRHEEKLAEIARRKAAGEKTDLVFIGDSITHHWEKEQPALWQQFYGKYNPLNLGYGGDRTENILWRLQHGEIDGIDPKVVVMMFGTNNTGLRQDAADITFKGIQRDVAEVRQRLPKAKILLLAIFPRGEGPGDDNRCINERINPKLPALADNRHVFFLNINGAFLGADGSLSKDIMPDLLHPNANGYRIWQREMQPTLDRLMR